MKTLKMSIFAAPLIVGSAAIAHPTNVRFETRGDCEAAYAESSKLDRQRLVDQLGIFGSYGAAQRTFNSSIKSNICAPAVRLVNYAMKMPASGIPWLGREFSPEMPSQRQHGDGRSHQ